MKGIIVNDQFKSLSPKAQEAVLQICALRDLPCDTTLTQRNILQKTFENIKFKEHGIVALILKEDEERRHPKQVSASDQGAL